ncbi:FAD-dependent oxidoreductase [Pseudonocardia sp. NPDC049154]|uniref:FAD-dependent oxidoreductase n=1 Tax=Pseudonocardia sp. NPDC049154 TaxID=3155501 RepID=UPI0033DC492C
MEIVVVGAGAAGLMTALLGARAGHHVTVLEREPLEPAGSVEEAAGRAFRPTAPQIVQPHVLLARYRLLLRDHLPDVHAGLVGDGAVESRLEAQLPPTLRDLAPEPGDDRFTMLLTRRSTLDRVLDAGVRAERGITLHTGATVRGLRTRGGAPPKVTGVRLDDGEVAADVVVDASGRRSRIDGWLVDAGARPRPVVTADCGLAYYSRHYRLRSTDGLPGRADNRTILPLDEFVAGMWGADNGTVVLGLCPLAEDHRFRVLRDPEVFTAVFDAVPGLRGWLDVLEPISDVFPMGGLHNTLHRLVDAAGPVALGLHAVGDGVCTTNPTLARGLGVALRTALDLVDVLAAHPRDPHARALAHDAAITEGVEPYYVDQARTDAARLARVRGVLHERGVLAGRPATPAAPPPPAPSASRVGFDELSAAALVDATLFRAATSVRGMLARPEDVYTDPAVVARVREVQATHHDGVPAPAQPDPDRLSSALATRA